MLALFFTMPSSYANETTFLKGKKEFIEKINKEFDITRDGTVDLHNLYGRIDVKTWEQAKVKIDITVTVNARDEKKAQQIFDRIKIDFANSRDFVKVETELKSNRNGDWSGIDKSDFTIDYLVFLPASIYLDLSMKYGAAKIAALTNRAKIVIKYGDLSMDGLAGDLDLEIAYGNGTVINCHDLDAEIAYGELRLNKGNNLKIDSKYSEVSVKAANVVRLSSRYDELEFGKIKELRNEGMYDDFEIESAEIVDIKSKYTDLKIDDLKQQGIFNMTYGDVDINTLHAGFKNLDINSKYADFHIHMAKNAGYDLDASGSHSDFHYPSAFQVKSIDDEGTDQHVRGQQGTGGKINARMTYGDLIID